MNKNTPCCIALTLSFVVPSLIGTLSIATAQQATKQITTWPMFERADIVTLDGKDIPEDYKRTSITDTQGRVIEGDWLIINRNTKTVQFRRTDGQEYAIPFSNICDHDRRYAELETGVIWDVGERFPSYFGRPLPKFEPDAEQVISDATGKYSRRYSLFATAWAKMSKEFSQNEMFDHLRVRTLTSSYICEYNDYMIIQAQEIERKNRPEAKLRDDIKPLTAVMKLLAKAEPPQERVSLATAIGKSGVRIFEEITPSDPLGEKQFGTPNTPPIDGMLQAYHFIAQYMHVSTGKTRIPLATLLSNTPARQLSGGYLSYDQEQVYNGIEKTFGVRMWKCYNLSARLGYQRDELFNFDKLLGHKLIRHYLRNNQPVLSYHPAREAFAIIIGFTVEPGKETTYDAIIIDGPISVGSQVKLPYKVSEESGITESRLLMSSMTVFIE